MVTEVGAHSLSARPHAKIRFWYRFKGKSISFFAWVPVKICSRPYSSVRVWYRFDGESTPFLCVRSPSKSTPDSYPDMEPEWPEKGRTASMQLLLKNTRPHALK